MSINSLTPAQEAYFNAINYRGAGNEAEILNYVLGLNDAQAKASYDAVTRSGPSLAHLVTASGGTLDSADPSYADTMQRATDTLYGNVGANIDARDWDSILSSGNVLQEANNALAAMYSDPAYREKNTASLVAQGYTPAQAYYTYGQMNDRVGANYVPTQSEISAVENYFKTTQGVPGYQWNVPKGGGSTVTNTGTTTRTGTTANTGAGSAVDSYKGIGGSTANSGGASSVMAPMSSGKGSGWNDRQVVGASSGQMLGAGNANYHSALIKSLRQNSMTPFSANTGVQMVPNMAQSQNSSWTPNVSSGSGAFNPAVLNPRVASQQEVDDWNTYSTYRTASLQNKTPYLSFSEWLSGGKSGTAPGGSTQPGGYQEPVYDPSLGGG